MGKNKQWETKNRIYTTYRGKTTYIVKPKVKEKTGDFTTVATGRISTGTPRQGYPEPVEDVKYPSDAPYNWPTTSEFDQLISNVHNRIDDILVHTKRESVRQDADLAKFHLRALTRYIRKALTY